MGKISIVGVLRLRAKSAVSRDRSVRRYAQDDDFVGVLKNKHPKQVSAYGISSWVTISRPYPGFPVELRGFEALHAPFFAERRTRGPVLDCVQEIRLRDWNPARDTTQH